MTFNENTLSIITATKNSAERIGTLIESLEAQTDRCFEWIVADGCSNDDTIEIIKKSKIYSRTKVIVKEDFGIYDAINSAVKACGTKYYIVLGDDDTLFNNTIAEFKKLFEADCDFVAAGLIKNNLKLYPERGMRWLKGGMAYISGHAVGTAIKTCTHKKYGYYSNKYPIVADQLFILNAVDNGARLVAGNFLAGNFSCGGVSSSMYLETQAQFLCVQIETGQNKLLQIVLFFLRTAKHILLRK